MTAVIEAASAGVKDMADGSLRITFEFEPRFAAEAFALFGPRGRAVAVAALKDGAGAIAEANPVEIDRIKTPESGGIKTPRREQGDLEMKAILWCKNPEFWAFLNHGKLRATIFNEASCTAYVKDILGIEKRRQIDEVPEVKTAFLEMFQGPFYRWNVARGLAQ